MADTTPITTAFEAQRATIEQSQRAFEHSVEFQRTAVHSYLDAVESTVPGASAAAEELRAAVDEQFEFLLDNHAEVFESVAAEYEDGLAAHDELTEDSLEALAEQVDLLVEAHDAVEIDVEE